MVKYRDNAQLDPSQMGGSRGGGGGKIALTPNPVVSDDDGELTLRNYQGHLYTYPSGV